MTDTRQALAALLPCPFCGNSKGLAVANENPQDLSGGYFIACPSCDASTGLRFACGEDPIPLLIEQWNRRAALAAQPVAGAVATDETGWLIEHSGEILPGVEQRAQVSWLRVQMKFNGYGAREFGFTHDANEALRFARREDAEAVLAMHLGARPPDWYSKPFSVTEHMWHASPQPQAAPAPEPSRSQKMREAGFTARDTRLTCDECGAKFTRQFAPLHECAAPEPSAQAVMTELEQRLIEIAKALPPMTTLGWNDGGMCEPDEAIKGYTKKQVLEILAQHLSASPQPEPSAQAVAHPSHQTVREWMPVSEALRLSDLWTAGDLDNCGQWRAAIKVLADEVRALAASPQPEPSAQGEPVAWVEPACHGNGGCCPDDKCEKWTPLASAPSTPPPAVVEAVPIPDCTVADVGFRWDMEAQRHVPQVLVEFEPTPPNSPVDAKGWKDRNAFAALVKSRGIAPKAAQP